LTPKDHGDRLQLQIALTELDTLTHQLNDTLRDSENRLEAKRLLSQIGARHSFKVDQRDVSMIRHDDIIEVVCIIYLSVCLLLWGDCNQAHSLQSVFRSSHCFDKFQWAQLEA